MTATAPPVVELYASAPGGARWGSAVWGSPTVWATAGWQNVTPLSVSGTISWGCRSPETGILAQPDADTWALTLHDPDRLLDPGNPNAAYAGDLHAGLPIRISHRGVVVRTGIVESIGHHLANDGGYIRATSVQAQMVKADVAVGTAALPDTLYARARAAIVAAGLDILVYGLAKPGLWDDPPVTPLVLTADRGVWSIITEAALACLQMPYIDRTGALRFRSWDNILDRSTILTTAEMVDLSAISSDAGLYSKVEVLDADGGFMHVRALTPPPTYGIVTYTRNVPTINAANWADQVLADRSAPATRWIPGNIFVEDAERLETLLTTDMLERVTMDADTPLTGAMVVMGADISIAGGTVTKGRWGINLKGKHQPLGPALGGIAAIIITNTTAVISWVTTTPSSSRVNYGTTSGYGSSTTLDTTLVTTHQQTITGLTPSTSYHYRVRSQDANGLELVSGDYTFTTTASGVDTTAPVISNIVATPLTPTTAQISWSLDEYATGQVKYSLVVGMTSPLFSTAETSYAYNAHSQTLSGLTPATTYYYQVISGDASGNIATSAVSSFVTPANVGPPSPLKIYGTAMTGDAKNNYPIGAANSALLAVRFRAPTTTTLTKIIWQPRWGTGGYSLGTGGLLKVSIQTDDGTVNHFPTGVERGSYVWDPDNSLSGGYVRGQVFTTIPSVTAGTLYHVVFQNIDPQQTTNFMSFNALFQWSPPTQRQPAFANDDFGMSYKDPTWRALPNDTADIDIVGADGTHTGSAYLQAFVDQWGVIAGPNNRVRELFTVSGGTRTVTKAWVRIGRQSGSGLLTVTLKNAAGTTIEAQTVAAAGVNTYTLGSGNDNGDWLSVTFGTPRTLTNGSTYSLEFSTDNASAYSMVPLRSRDGSDDGTNYMQSRAFRDGRGQKSTDGGGSWVDLYEFSPQNCQFYFETT
jgi:hypothetical protein